MAYGQKVMTIGGVRVTDAESKDGSCAGCVFKPNIYLCVKANERSDVFRNMCGHRNAIYIPAPDTPRDAYEQTDATAHLTDVEELK